MYRPMLFMHWKQVRPALALFAVASFALPLLAIQGMGTPPGANTASLEAYRLVVGMQAWLPAFPLLAAVIGVTLALSAWNWDHQQSHVYSLSLPVSRWEYTTAKMAAGVALALIPVAGLWLGAHIAAASLSLPAGLNAYPNQLAIRFFFATLVVYSVFFAMAAGTMRTTIWVLGGVLGFVIFGGVINEILAEVFHIDFFVRFHILEAAAMWLIEAPGPFEVVTGSWSLIDV